MVATQRLTLDQKLVENSDFLAEKYPTDESFLHFISKRFHFAEESLTFTNTTVEFKSDVIDSQNMTSPCWFGCAFEDVLTEIFTLFYKMKNYVYFCLVVILLILVCVLLNKIIKTFLYCTHFTVSKGRSYHCDSRI